MQSYNLKKLLLFVTFLVVFYLLLEVGIPWLVIGLNDDLRVIGIWFISYLIFSMCNYFFITPYFFKTGFSIRKFVLLLITFISVYAFFAFLLKSWIGLWEINSNKTLEFNLGYHVAIVQIGFFYLLFSTSLRVIQMHLDNQLKIKSLASERSKIELDNLQTNVESELISKYISYLQVKNETSSVSNEIVELADFLRHTTYKNDENKSPFSSELQELKRFKEVLYKSEGPELTIQNGLTSNPLIPVFSLLTPLKELLIKVNSCKEIKVYISGTGSKVHMTLQLNEPFNDGLSFELSKLNKDLNQLEVDII